MCQFTASLRPLSHKSYGGEEASRGRIHSRFGDRNIAEEAHLQVQLEGYKKLKWGMTPTL